MSRMVRVSLVFLFATGLSAQGTFVVDAAGGPGSSFTSIQTAVTTVLDGSTLIVRAGTYSPVDIYNKSLTIVGEPGVLISTYSSPYNTPYLHVRAITPGNRVYLRGLVPLGAGWDTLEVAVSPGVVIIDGAGQHLGRLSAFAADNLVVRDATFESWRLEDSGAALDGANVVFERCVLRGTQGSDPWSPGHGLEMYGVAPNTVQLVDSSVYGGDGYVGSGSGGSFTIGGAAAIYLGAYYSPGAVRILGDAGSEIRSGLVQSPTSIIGSGSIRRTGGVVFVPSVAAPVTDMPRLSSSDGVLGGTIDVTRSGPVGGLYVIGVSLPATISALPGVVDPVWLDGSSLVVMDAGVATQPAVTIQKTVPNMTALRGFTMVWQALDLDATGFLALSNPTATIVH